ncbi:YchJ family metal-binding protein [Sulfurimonas sp.]|uniref:YchJ family protein n=1 Tax=Sulfurimonas sp. TaxID=2022749 RepID=UPI0025E77C7F|nr:YchJ family metal-binding protein [Sulfurimonas sp.]
MHTPCSTPLELMRSRYEAFVKEDWDYIVETSIKQKIQDFKDINSTEWLKLDVLNAYDDIVEFKAYYRENAKIYVLHEKSSFVKVDGLWKYLDGELFNSKIERNETCPCGSTKKFKKCCA